MARHRHLDNAPIQEALFDIQFEPGTGGSSPGSAAEFIVNRFAEAPGAAQIANLWDTLFEVKTTAEHQSPPRVVPTSDVEGRRIDFPSKGQVVQLRATGFAFSRLPKYVDWAEACDAALAFWKAYATQIRPRVIKRVGVRYINALQLPTPVLNIGTYLPVTPDIPSALPQSVANFFHRLVIPKGHLIAQVTQAAQGITEDQSHLKVVLDLDVQCACDMPIDDEAGLQQLFGELRDYKNELFFEFLTDAAIGRYE